MILLRNEDATALREAYIRTRQAQRLYANLLGRLGPIRPLADLCDGAARQTELLDTLCKRFGLAVLEAGEGEPKKRFSTIPQAVHAALSAKQRGAAGSEEHQPRACAARG